MIRDFSLSAMTMGILTALVGIASSFVIVVEGLTAVGASADQAASGLMALSVAMGVSAIILSLSTRMPVSIAWSTPGAAFLAGAATLTAGFEEAVGAFIMCGVLLTLAGLWKPLAELVTKIPAALANAMLAGILFGLCLAPISAVAEYPLPGLAIVLAWVLAGRFHRLAAVPAALAVLFVVVIFFPFASTPNVPTAIGATQSAGGQIQSWFTAPVWISPVFSLPAFISLALPLFVVTMTSQNIPGLAVLNINHYRPDAKRLYSVTGLFSLLSAPFGGHAVNLAAITAALCAGPDAHPESSKRYWSAIVAGVCYIAFGLFASRVIAMVASAPAILVQAVAGLALISACTASMLAAFESPSEREPAAVTFFVTVSGVSFFGVSGAFWGLVAGWALLWFSTRFKRSS